MLSRNCWCGTTSPGSGSIVDARGYIWFTDPRYGADRSDLEMDVEGVYCIDPAGRVRRVLTQKEIDRPNGIAVAPDQKTLYVISTGKGPGDTVGGDGKVYAFDVTADNKTANKRVFTDCVIDGMSPSFAISCSTA